MSDTARTKNAGKLVDSRLDFMELELDRSLNRIRQTNIRKKREKVK
jgi:hypothetical protein